MKRKFIVVIITNMLFPDQERSFKNFFIPLTTVKTIRIIFIVGFVVFSNMLFNGFVADDILYILNNPQIHQFNLITSFEENSFNGAGQYRPIAVIYFSFLYYLFGNSPFFYHLSQIVLQVICTVLLFIFLKRFLYDWLALCAVLIFLVHPMQAESVSYISQTGNLLFSSLGLFSLLSLTRRKISKKMLCISFFSLLLAMLTKETGILFVLLILIYNIIFNPKQFLRLFICSLLIFILYGLIRLGIGHIGLETRLLTPIAELSLPLRLINAPLIIFYYLNTFTFPLKLAMDQQWTISSISFSSFYLPLLIDSIFFILIAVSGLFIFYHQRKNFKMYCFFLVWFIIGLLFHLQIFPLDHTVFNTWFYLPMMGLLGLLGILSQAIIDKNPAYKIIFITLIVILITALSLRTIVRNTNWIDAITLYNHDIKITNNYEIEDSLGMEYLKSGDITTAVKHLQKSVDFRPYEYNLQHLGLAYQALKNQQKAKLYLKMALHAKDYKLFTPHKHGLNTYMSYASFMILSGESSDAAAFLQEEALHDYPDSWQLYMYLALSKYMDHDKKGAIIASEKVYKYNPTETGKSVYLYLINHDSYTSQQLSDFLYSSNLIY